MAAKEGGIITSLYSAQDECFKNFVRSVFALSFLPTERIIPAFEGLVRTLDDLRAPRQRNTILEFLEYLWNTWIKDGSKFPKTMWNSLGLLDRRTNNDIEGYHMSALERYGRTKHLWHFVDVMKDEVENYEREIRMIQHGNPITIRRKEQRRREARINHMLTNYQANDGVYRSDLAFIEAMSHLEINF